MTEAEANEVRDAIMSGWITTGPRTKKLEKLVANFVGVNEVSGEGLEVRTQKTPNCVSELGNCMHGDGTAHPWCR